MSHSRQKEPWGCGCAMQELKLLCLRCSLPSGFVFEYCQNDAFGLVAVGCALVRVFWFSTLPNIPLLKKPTNLFIPPPILSVGSFYFTSLDSVLIRSPFIRLVGSLGNCRELLAQSSKVIKVGVLLSLAKERFDLEYVLGTSCRESLAFLAGRMTGGGVGCGTGSALPSKYLMMASFSAMALVRWQTLLFSNSCFISERFRQRWNCYAASRSWQFSP